MTTVVAPSYTKMKNFHPRYRPLSQPMSSLYLEPPESNLLYAPCSVFFFFFFLWKESTPFFVFLSSLLRAVLNVPIVSFQISVFLDPQIIRNRSGSLKKNQNAPRPSEHPPVRGKKCQNV